MDCKQQVRKATEEAIVTNRCFCWITKPFDVRVNIKPRRPDIWIDSTGILHRFQNQ